MKLNASNDFPQSSIRKQLEKICRSSEFQTKERARKLLKFLVEETLAGRADQLKGYTIGIGVFNRDHSFNPELDPIVRIQAGRLRRSLEMYYLSEGKEDKIRIHIPKGTYVPLFLNQKPAETGPAYQPEKINDSDVLVAKGPSIVVLPFTNLTGNPDKKFFVQGFIEELSQELTHYEDLRVIACRPVSGYEEKISDSKTFGQITGADYIIEGTVRGDENEVKISIKLTDTKTGEHLWGEQYRRDMKTANLLALQENIAQQVVATVAGEYGIIPQRLSLESRKKSATDLDVYDAMLRYYHYQIMLSPDTFLAAFSSLQNAVKKDPECNVALTMLANMYADAYAHDLPGIDRPLEQASDLLDKSMVLDPVNQLTRLVKAFIHLLKGEKELFMTEIDHALALNPNSPFRIGAIGFLLCIAGEYERGCTFIKKAMDLNPTFPNYYYGATCTYYFHLKEYQKAYMEAVKYVQERNFWCPMLRAAALGQLNRRKDAKQDLNDLISMRPDFQNSARDLINRYLKDDIVVDRILEGLRKAGLSVNEE